MFDLVGRTFTEWIRLLLKYPSDRIVVGSIADKICMLEKYSFEDIEQMHDKEIDECDILGSRPAPDEPIHGLDANGYLTLVPSKYKIAREVFFERHVAEHQISIDGIMGVIKAPTKEYALFRRINYHKITSASYGMQPRYVRALLELNPDFSVIADLFATSENITKRPDPDMLKFLFRGEKLRGSLVQGAILEMMEFVEPWKALCAIQEFDSHDLYQNAKAAYLLNALVRLDAIDYWQVLKENHDECVLKQVGDYFWKVVNSIGTSYFQQAKTLLKQRDLADANMIAAGFRFIKDVPEAVELYFKMAEDKSQIPYMLRRRAEFLRNCMSNIQRCSESKTLAQLFQYPLDSDAKRLGDIANIDVRKIDKNDLIKKVLTTDINYCYERSEHNFDNIYSGS